jgi:hypothetical protein
VEGISASRGWRSRRRAKGGMACGGISTSGGHLGRGRQLNQRRTVWQAEGRCILVENDEKLREAGISTARKKTTSSKFWRSTARIGSTCLAYG